MAGTAKNSFFDGNTFQRIGWRILTYLLTVITLGIAYPWAMCMMERWEIKHTVINGRRLKFTGHGGQLFGKYILWAFLCVITLGIYSIWFGLGMKKWVVSHTVYADDKSGAKSRFTGNAGSWFCYHLLRNLISVVTFGIGAAWGQKMLLRWETEHTEIGGKGLVFSGTGGQLFGKYLLFALLTVVTLGIYDLFFPVSLLKWQISHTARRDGPASEARVSTGLVVLGAVVLALVVVLGVVALAVYPMSMELAPAPSRPPQTGPGNQPALSAEEFEQFLMGGWSHAYREENRIYTIGFGFYDEENINISDTMSFDNVHSTHFPDAGEDEYGWYVTPMGHPSFDGTYSLTASGDGRFTLVVIGNYFYYVTEEDQYEQRTYELTYVDNDTILIDGRTYVRVHGSYTLEDYARIFGFDIEVEEAAGDPLTGT